MTAAKRVRLIDAPLELPSNPTEQDRERGMKAKAKWMFSALDVEMIYGHFNQEIFAGSHPEPKNREVAFIAYVKKKASAAGVKAG